MKSLPLILLVPVMAFGVTVEMLPQSEYADTEVSTNIPFEVSFDAMSRMNFSISLEASPSNCVEVSIGSDVNGDGVLSLDETIRHSATIVERGFRGMPWENCSIVRIVRLFD
ncbi:MAG: hypothetical protein KBT68_05745 [bacterium]|nr:hypothetical protein [Candidatus Colisoma equi]